MGCGISQFSLEEGGGGVGRGSRPIRQRIVGIRKNHHVFSDGNPSTKQLLKDGGEEDVVDSNDGRKSVSSPMKDFGGVKAQKVQEERIKAVDSNVPTKKFSGEEKERGAERREVEGKKDGAGALKGEKDSDNEEREEDEGRISDISGSLFMGSPSFRDYCMDYESEDSVTEDSVKYDDNRLEEKREKEPQMKEGSASLTPIEEPKTQSTKKERRGRRFRKVFTMGRPAAVRNLLNVTSCYSPNVAAHVRPGKPTEKAI